MTQAPLRPMSVSEFFASPKYAEATTAQRLAALDKWAAHASSWTQANNPNWTPKSRARETAKIREMRQAIIDGKRISESAGDVVRDVGVSMAASGLSMTAGAAAVINPALGDTRDIRDVGAVLGDGVTRILDRVGERRETTAPDEVERLAAEGFTPRQKSIVTGMGGAPTMVQAVDRREKLDRSLAEFKDALDIGDFPEDPTEFIGWLKERNVGILREAARYNDEPSPEIYTDQATRRFDRDLELQGLLAAYTATRNESVFGEIAGRLVKSLAREQADQATADTVADSSGVLGEMRDRGATLDGPLAGPLRALLGAPGISEAALEATGDPVELASSVVSAVLSGGTASAIKALGGKGLARAVGNTAADVAVEAGTEAFQAYVQDSRADIAEAAAQGGLVGLAFQLTGAALGVGGRVMRRFEGAAPVSPASVTETAATPPPPSAPPPVAAEPAPVPESPTPTQPTNEEETLQGAQAPEVTEPAAEAPSGIMSTAKPNGAKASFRYRVIERSALPQMLVRDIGDDQTRQRAGNVASDEQIEKIANGIDPDLLLDNRQSMSGAPVVAENTVIAGNGRGSGIFLAYERGRAGRYETAVREFAESQGISAEGIREPVLVREVIEFTQGDRASFVRESNSQKGGMLGESPSEQALLDADAIGDETLSRLTFTAAGNLTAESLEAVVQKLDAANRNVTRSQTGKYDTAEASKRIMAAYLSKLVARAGRDASDVTAILETDGGKRAVSVIAESAPRLAKLDDDLSLAAPLVDALLALKSGAQAVARGDFKNLREWHQNRKNELLVDQLDEVGESVLADMAETSRSAKAMSEFMREYLDLAEAEQIERDKARESEDIFGDERNPQTPTDIFAKLGRIAAGAAPTQDRAGTGAASVGQGAAESGAPAPDARGLTETAADPTGSDQRSNSVESETAAPAAEDQTLAFEDTEGEPVPPRATGSSGAPQNAAAPAAQSAVTPQPAASSVNRTISTGPNQQLGFSAMPDARALQAEAGRIAAGAPPVPGDSMASKIFYAIKSKLVWNGVLPRGMRELLRQAEYRRAGYEAMFTTLGNDLGKTINKYVASAFGKGASMQTQRIGALSYQALRGDVAAFNLLPQAVQAVVERGRKSMDLFSSQLIADGVVDGGLATKVGDNIGQYILREFQVFDPDANWNYDTIRQQHPGVYAAALQEVMASGNLTAAEADATIREMTDPSRARAFYLGTGRAGKIDISSFIRRKDLSQPILDLLGEVRDPVANLRNTGTKIAKIWSDHAAQQAVAEMLIRANLASRTRSTAQGRNWNRIGEESFEVSKVKTDQGGNIVLDRNGDPIIEKFRNTRTRRNMAGFGKLYTYPELAAAIDGYFETRGATESFWQAIGKVVKTITGTGKFAQVILNPAAYPTNMSGAVWTEIFNGRISRSGVGKFAANFAAAAKSDLVKYGVEEQQSLYAQDGAAFTKKGGAKSIRFEAFRNEMALRGIRDNSVIAGDLMATVKAGFGERWKRFAQGAGKLYQIPDNASKANAFAYELDKWAKAEPSLPLNRLMDLAAADVRATTQNYDRVPEAIKEASQYGLFVATYISFSWELARNTVNTAKIAAREVRSGNPVLVRAGLQRFAGMALTGAALYALNEIMDGDDEDKKEAIRRSYLPPWLQGQGVMILKSSGGEIRFADPAYLIPHQLFWNAIAAGIESDGPVDAVQDVVRVAAQSFSDLNIATQTVAEITANKKVGGNSIWNEEIAKIDPQHKPLAIAGHVIKSMYLPGIVRTIDKIRKAQKGEIGYMGNKATIEDVAAQAIGVRPYTVDYRAATADKLRVFASRYRTAASYSSDSRQKRQSPEDAARSQEAENQAVEALRKEVQALYQDASTLGVGTGEFLEMVKAAKLPRAIQP